MSRGPLLVKGAGLLSRTAEAGKRPVSGRYLVSLSPTDGADAEALGRLRGGEVCGAEGTEGLVEGPDTT